MSVIRPGEGRKQNRSGTALGAGNTAVKETERPWPQARIAPGPVMAETGLAGEPVRCVGLVQCSQPWLHTNTTSGALESPDARGLPLSNSVTVSGSGTVILGFFFKAPRVVVLGNQAHKPQLMRN